MALALLVVAAALLTAPIAPLEAARLGVIHPRLRGRGERARILACVFAHPCRLRGVVAVQEPTVEIGSDGG